MIRRRKTLKDSVTPKTFMESKHISIKNLPIFESNEKSSSGSSLDFELESFEYTP